MFTLNKPARVEARLLGPTGKLLRRFEPRQAQMGLNSLLWEGKTQSGTAASRGVYLLQLSAVDEEGNVAQAVTTVMVR
jgi:flagellar hook assembly protein FlgD